MAEVKWIKITTDMFDNRKVRHLRRLPDGNNIVLIWVMLLTMAGRCNSNGMIFLTENIPYTPKMLADELDFEENTVQLALNALAQLNMIVTDGGYFSIAGWEEYQNTDRLSEIREYNRIAQQKSRARRKQLERPENNVNDMSMTSQRCHDTDIDKDKEKDKDIKKESISCQQIVDLFHSICKSFSSIRSLSEARKKAISARLKTYSLEDFRTVFENAEASSFLKGANDRNWTATFDWLIKDANMAKVLDGKYADKPNRYTRDERNIYGASGKLGEAEVEAIQRLFKNEPAVTVDNNTELAAEAEQLAQQMKAKYGRKDAG